MFDNIFDPQALKQAWEVFKNEIPFAVWETLYVTVLSTAFAVVLGLPLGVEWAAILAVTGIFAGLFSWAGPFPAQITSMAVFICGAVYVYGVENWRLYLVPIIAGELLSAVPTSFGLIKQETRREATDDICDDVIAGIKANERTNQ